MNEVKKERDGRKRAEREVERLRRIIKEKDKEKEREN